MKSELIKTRRNVNVYIDMKYESGAGVCIMVTQS